MGKTTYDWKGEDTPAPVQGHLDGLRADFSDVVGAAGILAFCVDATDPAFPAGSAVLLSGDADYYRQTAPLFDAARLRPLAAVLAAALEALPRVCAVSRGRGGHPRYALRAHSDRAVPDAVPSAADLSGHPGLLAVDDDFAVLAASHGEDRGNPLFVLMMTDREAGERRAVYSASVHWLRWVVEAAAKAAAGVSEPSPSAAP